jgi:hypothetical protein
MIFNRTWITFWQTQIGFENRDMPAGDYLNSYTARTSTFGELRSFAG